ncbi:MAG: lipopolysaccharide biosynthesis protein [Mucilaginibacter sp.]
MSFYKSFGIYTICGLAAKGISFFLLPFFTYYLSQSEYGIIVIFSNSIYFIAPLMNLGIGETFTVEYPSIDKKQLASFVSTSLAIPVLVLLMVLLTVILFHSVFFSLTGLTTRVQYIVCFFSFSNFYSDYLFTILRNKNKPLSFGILAILKTVLELVLAVLFIRFLRMGYMGRVQSMFISTVVVFIVALFYFIKSGLITFSCSKSWILLILKRGLPAIPLFFMVFFLYNTDKYMVNYFFGAAKAGLYGLAAQFAFIITMLSSAFITPFYPFLYDNLNKGNYQKVVKVAGSYVLLLGVTGLLIYLFAPIGFRYFIAPKFQSSLYYLPFLIIGQFFYSAYMILGGLVYYKRQNNLYYFICPVVIMFSILVNYYLLAVLKITQFGYASVLSYLFCFSLIALFYRREIKRGIIILSESTPYRLNRSPK